MSRPIDELQTEADEAKARLLNGKATVAEVAAAQQAVRDARQAEARRPRTLADAADAHYAKQATR
jgi:hypothetical protein